MSEQIARYTRLFRWLAEQCWEGGEIDGYELQKKLQEAGVLVATTMAAPCGDNCNCAEYDADFPVECYRLDPAFARKPKPQESP